MNFDPATLLAQLVRIPSVNPMGRDVAVAESYEARLTDHLESLFRQLGLPIERQTIAPARDNIIARLDGGSPVVLLDAHQDTVPTDRMTIDPFGAVVRNGRLYGRGACDINGGMAAMLAAVARLARERPRHSPTVIMACTVNEEHGFSGAQALPNLWCRGARSIFPRRPDLAIVAEPTQLDVVVAHKGMVRWRCRTTGRAAHSSVPEAGDNAIFRMAQVLNALERYHREVLSQANRHPLCGGPTLSVGTIQGGISVNTVPDLCTIEIDRRLLPDDDPQVAYREVVDYLASAASPAASIEHLPPIMESRGLNDDRNGPLADRLAAVVRESRGAAAKTGVPFGTNAASYGAHCPTVVFGPGSISQAHTADEWVALDQVEAASEILYRFLSGMTNDEVRMTKQ